MNKIVGDLIKCLSILFVLSSCVERDNNNVERDEYALPVGYEMFQDEEISRCRYRVFAAYPDSVNGFEIKALMVAYIDTLKNQLDPTTVFILKHRGGETLRVETKRQPLLNVNEFRDFVNNNMETCNDTIVTSRYNCSIKDKKEAFNLNKIDGMPFIFLDVSFKNYPSLLIRRGGEGDNCAYYDVYGLNQNEIHKVDFKPYTEFKTQTSEWMIGYGTNIDYKKKEITVPSLAPGACACHGTIIYDHYKLDSSQEKFVHHRSSKKYELED